MTTGNNYRPKGNKKVSTNNKRLRTTHAHRPDKLDEVGLICQIYKLRKFPANKINCTDLCTKGN